jgi:hypothetical protein
MQTVAQNKHIAMVPSDNGHTFKSYLRSFEETVKETIGVITESDLVDRSDTDTDTDPEPPRKRMSLQEETIAVVARENARVPEQYAKLLAKVLDSQRELARQLTESQQVMMTTQGDIVTAISRLTERIDAIAQTPPVGKDG